MGDRYLKASFASPALVLDLLSFIYRLAFIDKYETNPHLMSGFYRCGSFSVAGTEKAWREFFGLFNELDKGAFFTRQGMSAYAVYKQFSVEVPGFVITNLKDVVADDDPVLIKAALFEECKKDITFVEFSNQPIPVEA